MIVQRMNGSLLNQSGVSRLPSQQLSWAYRQRLPMIHDKIEAAPVRSNFDDLATLSSRSPTHRRNQSFPCVPCFCVQPPSPIHARSNCLSAVTLRVTMPAELSVLVFTDLSASSWETTNQCLT